MKIKNLKYYKKMIIIVDMINGFAKKGDLADPKIANIIPRQIELIEESKKEGALIVFIKDVHTKDSCEHKRFNGKFHGLKGSGEELVVDELKPYEQDAISIEKNSTSFMEAPAFRNLISTASNLERVEIVGCCTDICVANGTIGLANYFDQWNKNVDIIVHEDAIATFLEEQRQQYVEAAKILMTQQGIKLVKRLKTQKGLNK